jgi:hypothetical protein
MGQVGDQFQSSDGRWHDSASAANDWNLQSNAGGGPDKLTMAQAELAGAAVGAAVAGGIVLVPILLKILMGIATVIGFVFAILPGLILGLIMKIPLLGRVIHTAVFAVIVTIFLVSICLTVGTAFGHYEGITFGIINDLTVIGEIGGLDKGATIGQFVNALLATYSPTVIFPCLALGVLAAMIFYWMKLYHWVKKTDVIDFIIITAISLGACVVGGIITMIVGKFAPIWIKGLLNSIFIAIAFYFWYTQAKEDKPYTEEEIKQMTRAASAGNAKVQFDLGAAYGYGQNGVEVDFEKGIMWMSKAADQNYETRFDSAKAHLTAIKKRASSG